MQEATTLDQLGQRRLQKSEVVGPADVELVELGVTGEADALAVREVVDDVARAAVGEDG